MAIIKLKHSLQEAKFIFDESGEVIDLIVEVAYQLYDDIADEEEARVRKKHLG